jgi:hypothetical protein
MSDWSQQICHQSNLFLDRADFIFQRFAFVGV